MKKVVFYIVLFCVVIMLSGFKYESAVEQQISVAERNGISDALPESAEKILESLGLDDISADSLSNLPLDDIIRLIGESIKEEVKAPFIAIVSVCAAGILCNVINNFGKGETKTVYCTVCTLAVSAAVIIPVKDVIYSAAKVITECSDFMLGFIPIYSSVIAASGGISAAARAASARTQLRRNFRRRRIPHTYARSFNGSFAHCRKYSGSSYVHISGALHRRLNISHRH